MKLIPPEFNPLQQSEAAKLIEDSENKIDAAFRARAERDLVTVKNMVLEALVEEIEETKTERPELNEIEAIIVGKRVLKQRLSCLMSVLDQIY